MLFLIPKTLDQKGQGPRALDQMETDGQQKIKVPNRPTHF